MKSRALADHELLILKFLLQEVNGSLGSSTRAYNLDDGDMGSIRFVSELPANYAKVSSCVFRDSDELPVYCDLFMASDGSLVELSLWKADFSSVEEFPTNLEQLYKET